MLTYLPDYIALIQLLVGSIIVSSFFQREFADPLEVFRKDVKDSPHFQPLLSPLNLIVIESNSAKKSLQALRRSLMLVLSIYGCMVLFYCASFPNEHTVSPISVQYDGKIVSFRNDLSTSLPSPFGVALLSLLVTIYQVHVIRKPSTRIQSNNIFYVGGIVSMFLVFFIFILLFPSTNFDLSYFFGNRITKRMELCWVMMVNSWVLFNLVSWIGFHIRLHLASTKRHYNQLENRAKKWHYKREIYAKTKSLIGIKDRFCFILEELDKQKDRSLKKYLIKKAKQELKIESNYYSISFSPTNPSQKSIMIYYDVELTESLKSIIEKNTALTNCQRKKLIRLIIKEPKIHPSNISSDIPSFSSEVYTIYTDLDRLDSKLIRELFNLGIITRLKDNITA